MEVTVYVGLFAAAFLAATIIPAQSESVLVALLAQRSHSAWALVLVASVGNVLGSVVNWWLGRGLERFKGRRWFPVSEAALTKAQARYARYGRWSLLLSWVPIIGDPITVAAGVMRERFLIFVTLVGIAKTLRYVVLAKAYLWLG
jgi:membrane protein YqaA with SNARE-associated domain